MLDTPEAGPRPDLCVFIGRFQPPHAGHLAVMREALRRGDRLLVLVGSANEPRSFRNPFTADERQRLILSSIPEAERERVVVLPLEDSNYMLHEWIASVQRSVEEAWRIVHAHEGAAEPRIALIGHSKDSSSYYLKLFPEWAAIEVVAEYGLNATAIREQLFGDPATACRFLASEEGEGKVLPQAVTAFLKAFVETDDYRLLGQEHAHVAKYRREWSAAPYPPTFVTADAVVIQSGHVLVVKRKGFPGRGLWALPGGFINQDEYIEAAMIRELREETGIDLPEGVLRSRIVAREVFDNPYRSSRGRTITHAFLVHLEPGAQPPVTAADDAEEALWMPLGQLERSRFFEDHYAIIRNLVARI